MQGLTGDYDWGLVQVPNDFCWSCLVFVDRWVFRA